MTAIDEATALSEELMRVASGFDGLAHKLNNALRNARIAKSGSGILHRTPPPYDVACQDVAAMLEEVRAAYTALVGRLA